MDDIVFHTLQGAIAEAQSRRAAAQAELDDLRSAGAPIEFALAEAAFEKRRIADDDLRCLDQAYRDLGGNPDVSFS